MSWTEFLKTLILLYAAYYTFFIALDMLRARTGKQNKDQPLVLSFPQEAPTIVSVSRPQEGEKEADESLAASPPPKERDWQQDIPEQDPEELYEEELNEQDEDDTGGQYMQPENTGQAGRNEASAAQVASKQESIDPRDTPHGDRSQEHRSEAPSAPGSIKVSAQLASGITGYSGAIELTDLFAQVLDGGMELIDKLYIKSALE